MEVLIPLLGLCLALGVALIVAKVWLGIPPKEALQKIYRGLTRREVIVHTETTDKNGDVDYSECEYTEHPHTAIANAIMVVGVSAVALGAAALFPMYAETIFIITALFVFHGVLFK